MAITGGAAVFIRDAQKVSKVICVPGNHDVKWWRAPLGFGDRENIYDNYKAFISHDLEVVRFFADRVLVMKSGAFVEEGEVEALFTAPTQPYTQALVTATPRPKWEELPAATYQPA